MKANKFIKSWVFIAALVPWTLQAENSSMAARKKLYIQTEVHLGPNGYGGGLGLFLPGDCRLDLNYSESMASYEGISAEVREYRAEIQSFVGNSFYYSLGVTHRKFKVEINELDNYDSFVGERYTSEVESTGPHFLIGNEWQWDHLFIGAEWIGFMKPAAWSYTNTYSDDVLQADRTRIDDNAKTMANLPSLISLTLSIGLSF